MSEMIGRMLTVAKLDTSSAPVQMTRIDLSELVSQVVSSAEFELRERDNAVRLTIRGLCLVRGNAELLQSAVENVIRNAARYTTSNASVDIHLERLEREDGSFILLSVRDDGVGFLNQSCQISLDRFIAWQTIATVNPVELDWDWL